MKYAFSIRAAIITLGVVVRLVHESRRFKFWLAWRNFLKRTRSAALRPTPRADSQKHFNNVVRPHWNRK